MQPIGYQSRTNQPSHLQTGEAKTQIPSCLFWLRSATFSAGWLMTSCHFRSLSCFGARDRVRPEGQTGMEGHRLPAVRLFWWDTGDDSGISEEDWDRIKIHSGILCSRWQEPAAAVTHLDLGWIFRHTIKTEICPSGGLRTRAAVHQYLWGLWTIHRSSAAAQVSRWLYSENTRVGVKSWIFVTDAAENKTSDRELFLISAEIL